MFFDVALVEAVTGFATEDDQFANDVGAAQIDAWVGLAVAFVFGTAHGLGERHLGREGVEDEVERAAEHSLQFQNLVAAVDEVVDGVNDGQTGADVGLEEELDAAATCRSLEAGIVVVVGRRSDLVGGDDRDAVFEEVVVEAGYFAAGGAVNKDAVEDVHAYDFVVQALQVAGRSVAQVLAVVFEVESVAAEHGVVSAGDADDVESESAFFHQAFALAGNLLDEAAAYGSDAADEEVGIPRGRRSRG